MSVDVDARKGIFFTNDPDLYVKVTAHNKEGKRKTKSTRILKGATAHRWNQDLEVGKTTWDYFLEFKKSTWDYFTIQAFDDDPGRDDELSSLKTVHLGGPVLAEVADRRRRHSRTTRTHDCYGGAYSCTLTYKYKFIKD